MSKVNLISWDAEVVCENAAAILNSAEPALESILLIAEDPSLFSDSLQKELHLASIAEYIWNPEFLSNPGLPFANMEFQAVVSFDLIGQIPKHVRSVFLREAIRVSRRETLLISPLGTDLQRMIEQSLAKQYQEVFLSQSQQLQNHLDYGLPTPDEVFSWIAHGEAADIFYAGNVLAYQQHTENLLMKAHKPKGVIGTMRTLLKSETTQQNIDNLELETVPMRRHRRLYLTLRK